MALAKRFIRLVLICLGLLMFTSGGKAQGTLITVFTNPSPTIGDSFGASVVTLGSNKVVIGARRADTGASDAGAAYLFDLTGSLLCIFTNPTPAVGDFFGNAMCAVADDQVLISSSGDDSGATDTGIAYLFNLQGNVMVTFSNPTPTSEALFGSSLTWVGGDKIAIGARGAHAGTVTNAGAVYIFNLQGQLQATIPNPTPGAGDYFGNKVVATSDGRIIITATRDSTSGPVAGIAYLYDLQGNVQMTFTNPHPTQPLFAYTAAIAGQNRVVLGQYFYGQSANASVGRAYLFDFEGKEVASFLNPFPEQGDWFGTGLSDARLGRMIIGASYAGASSSGMVYVMDFSGKLLTAITNPVTTTSAGFGEAIATVDAKRFVVGAPSQALPYTRPGTAYLIGIELPPPHLEILSFSNSTFTVSWPSAYTDFSLQQNTSLMTANWIDVPEIISDDGTNRSFNAGYLGGQLFFRLSK